MVSVEGVDTFELMKGQIQTVSFTANNPETISYIITYTYRTWLAKYWYYLKQQYEYESERTKYNHAHKIAHNSYIAADDPNAAVSNGLLIDIANAAIYLVRLCRTF